MRKPRTYVRVLCVLQKAKIGYEADMNKLGFCIYYNGYHFDALLPFEDNPQQFVPHFDCINMSL